MLADTELEGVAPAPSEPRADAASADARVSILVVEPDDLSRELVANGLALWSRRFEIAAARDLEAAAERIAEREPDVVISEIVFGGVTRREAYGRLRARTPRVSWIVLTDSHAQLFRLGFEYDALVAKPPEIADLGDRIERLLDRRRQSVVRGIELASFLQVLSADAKSGTLEVRAQGGSGSVGLARGQVVHAEAAGRSGRDALF